MMSYRMEIVEDKDEGGIAAAMGSTMPTTANPTAQGMISVTVSYTHLTLPTKLEV